MKVDGSVESLAASNPVAISGRTVTLTLAAPVANMATVTVSYTDADGSNRSRTPPGADVQRTWSTRG